MRHISHNLKNDTSDIYRILADKIKTTHRLGLDYSGKMCRFKLAHRYSRCGTTSFKKSRVKYFFLDCLTIRDELDTLSRNFGSHLRTYPAQNRTRVKTSFRPRRKTGTVRWRCYHLNVNSAHMLSSSSHESHSVRMDNSTFERVEEFKYLGTTLTYQNSISEENKSRLRSGNACGHSVQNLSSSRLLTKSLKIKKYRTIILPVVLYGCETWSLTLRVDRKLRVFENMALRRIFGPDRKSVV